MIARAARYAVREALLSLRRNWLMTAASVSTVGVCLLVLAGTLLVAANLDRVAGAVEGQVQIRVFVAEGTPRERLEALRSELAALEGVKEVRVVTKEEALERLKAQFGDKRGLLEAVEESNPLRDSLEIAVLRPDRVAPVAEAARAREGVAEVAYGQGFVEKLFRVTGLVRAAGLTLVGLLVAATVLIISNTIRLTVFARREEIGIMKLVGATDWFVRWPFVVEGMLMGLLGAVLTAALTWQAYHWAVGRLADLVPFIPLVTAGDARVLLGDVAVWLFTVGALVGAAGSAVSVRRYLRV